MIPLVDAFLREKIQQKISWLKANPQLIDKIFGTLGTRTTLKSFTDFIVNREIKVLIGFPKESQQLPCYVITVAGEQESAIGLGENIDDYEEPWDDDDPTTQFVLDGIDMESTYRVECWSDNGDLTAYMYSLLKWCLLSSRKGMLDMGFKLPRLTGTDLEPVPDYIPIFVYRRALMITFKYENLYFDDETPIGEGAAHMPRGITAEDIGISNHLYKPMDDDSDI